jgi:hypothetical protein
MGETHRPSGQIACGVAIERSASAEEGHGDGCVCENRVHFAIPTKGSSTSLSGVGHGLDGTSNRRIRGGSWNNNADNATVANRDNNNNPDNRNNNIGFRLVRSSGRRP